MPARYTRADAEAIRRELHATPPDLDPRWEWCEIAELGTSGLGYARVRCKHLEMVPVESLDGEDIARLCLTCDRQFYRGSAAGGRQNGQLAWPITRRPPVQIRPGQPQAPPRANPPGGAAPCPGQTSGPALTRGNVTPAVSGPPPGEERDDDGTVASPGASLPPPGYRPPRHAQ